MTGLRVFEDVEGRLFLEITAPGLNLGRALFVPAVLETFSPSQIVNPSARVSIRFQEKSYIVAFLFVTSLVPDQATRRFNFVGVLEATDSINVLNNLVDVLAYPGL